VQNVNVYLDGTRIGTTTDASGKFELTVSDIIYTSLVFSHVSYKQFTISDPYNNPPDTIFLIHREYELGSVEVTAKKDPFTREEKMKAFKEQFLGTDKAGKSCIIENEDDIYLYYNTETNSLSARSKKPLLIKNKYLGYELSYELLTFNLTFNWKIISEKMGSESLRTLQFYGTAFFSDNNPDSKKIKRRREKIYQKSVLFFFKSLVNNTLKESKFMLFSNGMMINHLDCFEIQDTLSLKKVNLVPEKLVIPKISPYDDVTGSIGVLYDKKERTNVLFRTDSFMIDNFGYTYMKNKIVFSGGMGDMRVGNMLPIDYLPDEGDKK
jgi:hypothetical protein